MDWKLIGIYCVPVLILLAAVVIWLFLRRTIRTRLRMTRQLRDDPGINDWMVLFNWSRKILYIPTVVASLVAAGLMLLFEQRPELFEPSFGNLLGGIWLGIFFVNFLIDEYELDLKVLVLIGLALVVLWLWLTMMHWLMPFLNFFRHLGVSVSAMGYLLISLIFLMAIIISWSKGLFYYVALTPNYLNIQNGPNETSEQVSREAFSTRIDTGDFLERVLGFGQIIVTFSDTRRQPLVLLVGRIGNRALRLESIRGHLAVDSVHQTPDVGMKDDPA
ncbi:MAG: hypothetical protein NTW21_30390 [Verrucomicrobia bacterium]|nr:hypothetical protein [Verrucomicrobiota bacterium]